MPEVGEIAVAHRAVEFITEPELKKRAFEFELDRLGHKRKRLDRWIAYLSGIAGVGAVIITLLVNLASYVETLKKQADARTAEANAKTIEAEARKAEAHRPWVELRRDRYLEILRVTGTIAAKDQDPEKLEAAKVRFWELYWTDLTLVEDQDIDRAMAEIAPVLDPDFKKTPLQDQILNLAKMVRSKITTLEQKERQIE